MSGSTSLTNDSCSKIALKRCKAIESRWYKNDYDYDYYYYYDYYLIFFLFIPLGVKITGVKNRDKKIYKSRIGQRSGSSCGANVSEKSAELNLLSSTESRWKMNATWRSYPCHHTQGINTSSRNISPADRWHQFWFNTAPTSGPTMVDVKTGDDEGRRIGDLTRCGHCVSLKPGFHPNAIACVGKQPIMVATVST